MDTKIKDKVVLITGANHGIGAATAHAFSAQGARVVIHYLATPPASATQESYRPLHVTKGKPAADDLVDELQESGAQAMAVEADLSKPEIIPTLFDRVEAALGQVDVLVNNAAHCEEPDTIYTVTAGSLDRTFAVNMRATVLLIAEYVKRYQKRKGTWGRIVNLSTDAAQYFASQIVYGASKATIEAFTRSIAIEIASLGILVNTVAPGPVQTGWMTHEMVEKITPDIPLGRVGEPEDIADVIVFLASHQARWLTGQVIKVSGGHNL
jgi:3-oxoacyl-[acyl-carrier protein] reductase